VAKIETQTKSFIIDNLQPGKTYRAVVRAFDDKNKGIGRSENIEFKTRGKDTSPPAPYNLQGDFNGSTLNLTWEYGEFPKDFSGFIVTLSNLDESISTQFDVSRNKSFSLSYPQILAVWGATLPSIVVSVFARDNSGNASESISETFIAQALADPTNVTLQAAGAGYIVSWDIPTELSYDGTNIYESDSEGGTYTRVYSSTSAPTFVASTNYTPRYVKVAHFAIGGIETNLVASTPKSVTPINPNVIDEDPPEQRNNIVFTPAVGAVTVSWTNSTNESLNQDLSGISIRYAKTSSPTNYTWVRIPFTFTNPLTSATINNLLPATSYKFELATFDKTENYTEYSTAQTVLTLADSTPPPAPKAPVVSGGSTSGGPFIIRVTQESIENGTTNPLPIDTSYFKIYMLDSGYDTAPGTGVSIDNNATQIGLLTAAFNGGESQNNFYVPLTDGEQRYFYTRAVDTSSNISNASPASQSSAMTVIDNAYISNLSADKITAGRLNANEYIQVGNSSEQITIKSTSTLGQIYSGSGVYGTDGLYLDTSGKFSLKNRLIFDGTNLSIEGSITATNGSFTGKLGIGTNGGIYIGSNPNSGARIVLNNSSIGGYSSDTGNPQTFLFTTSGISNISGWNISQNTIYKTNSGGDKLELDSSNAQITAGNSTSTIGIRSDASGEIALWAGTQTPSTSSPFYVTNTGQLNAVEANIVGVITGSQAIFTGELGVPSTTLTYGGLTRVPTVTIDSGSGTGDSSYLAFLRRVGEDHDSAMEFFVELNSGQAYRRGRISHDGGEGGSFNISAYPSSSGITSGILNLEAKDGNSSTGTIDIKASKVLVNGVEIASAGGSLGGYYNRDYTTRTNKISYSTLGTSSISGTIRDGDIHIQYES